MFFLSGFGSLIYIVVLLLNSIAVLSEDRFLARIGLSRAALNQPTGFGGTSALEQGSLKANLANLIYSIRTVTRPPLIVANLAIIFYEILLG